MSSIIVAEIFAIIILIMANGVLAMAEIAVVSARKVRLQKWSEEGDSKAKAALDLANSPEHFLSTIQSGITLIGVCAGAIGGATLADELAAHFNRLTPWMGPWSDTIAIALIVGCISYLSLVFGELVPKRLALTAPERVSRLIAAPMSFLTKALFPLVKVLSISTEAVMTVIGKQKTSEPPITEAEIHVLVEEGMAAGVFHEAEPELVRRILDLDQVRVSTLMTPKRDLVWIDTRDPSGAILAKIQSSTHTRFPVAEGGLDNVIGLVNSRDVFVQWVSRATIDLQACLYKPLIVPESLTALEVLESFKQGQIHVAMVMNEYGGLLGLVTITDIVEAVLGDLPEAGDTARWQAVRREDGSWLFDAITPVSDFKRTLSISTELPEEKDGYYQTLGGFVLHQLEHVPKEGEYFRWDSYRFEIVDMDRHRIDKVLVSELDDTTAKLKSE